MGAEAHRAGPGGGPAEGGEEQNWTDALAYRTLLTLIHPDNKQIETEQEDCTRRARLELLYKDEETLEKRIKDVDKDLLRSVVREINRSYYETPDFKRMAEGAIDNLIALAETQQVYGFLHGLGNPETREYFINQLRELRKSVAAEERYNHRDLLKLYNRAAYINPESVELPEGLLVVEFLEGAIHQLDDFTAVVWPVDAADFDKVMMGDFDGVGIQLALDEHTRRLKVVTPLEDSPALEAGVQPGDLIVEVDGESTKGWDTTDAVARIMGKAESDVTLTIFRPSSGKRLPFTLKRRKIVLRTVRGVERRADDPQSWEYMLDKDSGIAYVRLSGFHRDSVGELVKALKEAEAEGMRGLILDVRHNPGGLLDVAVRIVSMFLRQGEVVSTGGRNDPRTSLRATEEDYVTDVPMVVLVNDASASASEILAGALRDQHRAIVLGERTFGKGSVQRVLAIGKSEPEEQARVKLTTSLYYLPSGRSPHKGPDAETWGVDPDWQVKLTPKEFRHVLEHENESSVIHNEEAQPTALDENDREQELEALKADEEKDDHAPLLTDEQIKALEDDPIKALDSDPQLETALLLLRVKLAGNLPWPREIAANVSDSKP